MDEPALPVSASNPTGVGVSSSAALSISACGAVSRLATFSSSPPSASTLYATFATSAFAAAAAAIAAATFAICPSTSIAVVASAAATGLASTISASIQRRASSAGQSRRPHPRRLHHLAHRHRRSRWHQDRCPVLHTGRRVPAHYNWHQ